MSAPTARRYMATIYDLSWDTSKCSGDVLWLRGQEEVCPDTNRVHYQIYFKLRQACRIPAAKKALGCETAHLDRCQGDHEQCLKYVTKEDTRKVGGKTFALGKDEEVGQGKRNDVKKAMEAYRHGGISAVMEQAPEYAFSHSKQLINYHQLSMQMQFPMHSKEMLVIFCQGKPGVGKSLGVVSSMGPNVCRIFPQDDGRVWFDGYDPVAHKVLFLDDVPRMKESHMKKAFWLKTLDRYIDQVQTKGGFTRAAWNMVIIVSNHPYAEVFGDDEAISRRVHIRVEGAFDKYWLLRALVKAESQYANRFLIESFWKTWDEGKWKPNEEITVKADCPKEICVYPDEVPPVDDTPLEPDESDDDDDIDDDIERAILDNAYYDNVGSQDIRNAVQDDKDDDASALIDGMCERTQLDNDEPGFDDDSFDEEPRQVTPKRKMPDRRLLKRAKARFLDDSDVD